MNAVNKKVSSHSRIRRPAMRRNQDGALLRKSFLEHLRIPEQRSPAKEKVFTLEQLSRATKEMITRLWFRSNTQFDAL